MGAGGEQLIGGPAPRQHHRRRRAHLREDDTGGLDLPPPALSLLHGCWSPRRLNLKTMQHMCTLLHPPPLVKEFTQAEQHITSGTAPCDPIVAFHRYIVTATDDGRVCFYDISRDDRKSVCEGEVKEEQEQPRERSRHTALPRKHIAPVAVLSCGQDARVVATAATRSGVSTVNYIPSKASDMSREIIPPLFVGHVVALTSEGVVCIIECTEGVDSGLRVAVAHSWNTNRCNPCCLDFCASKDGERRLCIGYESGCLEEWKVMIPVVFSEFSSHSTANVEAPTETKVGLHHSKEGHEVGSSNSPGRMKPLFGKGSSELIWRGCFETSIRSIASLVTPVSDNTECAKDSRDEDTRTSEHGDGLESIGMNSLLAVCIEVRPLRDERLGTQTSSSSVEVINVTTLETDWNSSMKDHAKERTKDEHALALGDYCIWPEAGKEILNTSTLPSNDGDGHRLLPRRMRAQPTRSSDRLCAGYGGSPYFAAALSDGTVVLLDAAIGNGDIKWGVSNFLSQICLSFPAVGLAHLNLASESCFACCLRGGTVYVISLVDNEEADNGVTVFLPPDESAVEDPAARYVHGFAAGNIYSPGKSILGEPVNELPVVVYAGAVGVVDVFAGGFIVCGHHEGLIQDLLEKGYVQLLLDTLLSMDEDDALLENEMYRLAREELLASNLTGQSMTLEHLLSPKCTNIQFLLLHFGRER